MINLGFQQLAFQLYIYIYISISSDYKTSFTTIQKEKEHGTIFTNFSASQVGDIPDAEIKPPENVLFVCKLNPVTQVGAHSLLALLVLMEHLNHKLNKYFGRTDSEPFCCAFAAVLISAIVY